MPSYTSSTRLARVQYDPALDGTVIATSFFETTLTNDDDPDDVSVKPWEAVTHPIPDGLAAQVEAHAADARDILLAAKIAEKAALLDAKSKVSARVAVVDDVPLEGERDASLTEG